MISNSKMSLSGSETKEGMIIKSFDLFGQSPGFLINNGSATKGSLLVAFLSFGVIIIALSFFARQAQLMGNLEDTAPKTTEPDFAFNEANPFNFEDPNLFIDWAVKESGNYKVYTVDTAGLLNFN